MVCKKCGYSPGVEEKLDRCPMCDERWESGSRDVFGAEAGESSWKQHRGIYITIGVVAVGVILLLALLLGGRSGGSGGGGSAAAGTLEANTTTTSPDGAVSSQTLATYVDTEFGFSFQYPSQWEIVEDNNAQSTAGASAASAVAVVDPAGSVAGNEHIDLLQLSVYQLAVSVDSTMMADVHSEVETVVGALLAQGADAQVVDALAETTAAGMPGFKVTFSFTKEGVATTSTMYFLFVGDREYQLTLQAASAVWQTKLPALEAISASFNIGGTNTTVTTPTP